MRPVPVVARCCPLLSCSYGVESLSGTEKSYYSYYSNYSHVHSFRHNPFLPRICSTNAAALRDAQADGRLRLLAASPSNKNSPSSGIAARQCQCFCCLLCQHYALFPLTAASYPIVKPLQIYEQEGSKKEYKGNTNNGERRRGDCRRKTKL